MRSSHAKIRMPDGRTLLCYPGDLVGRLEKAEIRIPDPRISEAHALFSLRGGGLWLLFLRSNHRLEGGALVRQIELTPGLRIGLTHDLVLEVLGVVLSTERIALALPGTEPETLGDRKYAINPNVRPFLDPQAEPVRVWCSGSSHQILADTGPVEIEPGETYQVECRPVTASLVDAAAPGTSWTQLTSGSIETVITVTSIDRARVEDSRGLSTTLRNQAATVLYTIAQAGGKAGWLDVAIALWGRPGRERRENLRNNVLYRMDKTLRDHGLQDGLVVRRDGLMEFGPGVSFRVELEDGPRDNRDSTEEER